MLEDLRRLNRSLFGVVEKRIIVNLIALGDGQPFGERSGSYQLFSWSPEYIVGADIKIFYHDNKPISFQFSCHGIEAYLSNGIVGVDARRDNMLTADYVGFSIDHGEYVLVSHEDVERFDSEPAEHSEWFTELAKMRELVEAVEELV